MFGGFVEDVANSMEPCKEAGAVVAEEDNSKQFSMTGQCPWVESPTVALETQSCHTFLQIYTVSWILHTLLAS